MRSKKISLEVYHCELESLRKKPALKSFHFEVQTMEETKQYQTAKVREIYHYRTVRVHQCGPVGIHK